MVPVGQPQRKHLGPESERSVCLPLPDSWEVLGAGVKNQRKAGFKNRSEFKLKLGACVSLDSF